MQIKRIQIYNLFGMFDHDIKLKIEDRISIIHGPNGVGKTTILKLVKDIFESNWFSVQQVPFDKVIIRFNDSHKLEVKKLPKTKNTLLFKVYKGRNLLHDDKIKSSVELEGRSKSLVTSMIEDIIPNLDRVGPRAWYDLKSNETLSLNEVLFKYNDLLPTRFRQFGRIKKETSEFLSNLKTYFIQTQRLIIFSEEDIYRDHRTNHKTRHTVQQYSIEMSEMLQDKLRQSGSVAASLDRTFPHRLLGPSSPKNATEKKIREKYLFQSEYRGRLMKSGLIDEEEQVSLPESNISRNDLKVLWYYLSDIDSKLKVFDSLLKKAELFLDIINSRFLYKSLSINKDIGFVVSLDSGKNVPLNCLSSGEQHELVLAYELLFKVPEKSFIMIDEPELSLHVSWQHKFLNDIERISKLADLDFLIATHSPSIIHDRRSLMIQLPN